MHFGPGAVYLREGDNACIIGWGDAESSKLYSPNTASPVPLHHITCLEKVICERRLECKNRIDEGMNEKSTWIMWGCRIDSNASMFDC